MFLMVIYNLSINDTNQNINAVWFYLQKYTAKYWVSWTIDSNIDLVTNSILSSVLCVINHWRTSSSSFKSPVFIKLNNNIKFKIVIILIKWLCVIYLRIDLAPNARSKPTPVILKHRIVQLRQYPNGSYNNIHEKYP